MLLFKYGRVVAGLRQAAKYQGLLIGAVVVVLYVFYTCCVKGSDDFYFRPLPQTPVSLADAGVTPMADILADFERDHREFALPAACGSEQKPVTHWMVNPLSPPLPKQSIFNGKEYGRGVFVVGCGHSGTSLLLKMLGSHPQVFAIPRETQMFTTMQNKQPSVASIEREITSWISYGDGDKPGARARVWVEKTPGHICALPFILSVFPLAKIVVIMRDGRDVVAGLLRDRGYSLSHAAARWVNDNAAALHFRRLHGSRFFFLKYEELVIAPEPTVRRLCAFLDLPFFSDMVQAFQKTTFSNGNELFVHPRRRHQQLQQPLYDGRGRWRQDLTPDQRQALYPLIHTLLEDLQYNETSPW